MSYKTRWLSGSRESLRAAAAKPCGSQPSRPPGAPSQPVALCNIPNASLCMWEALWTGHVGFLSLSNFPRKNSGHHSISVVMSASCVFIDGCLCSPVVFKTVKPITCFVDGCFCWLKLQFYCVGGNFMVSQCCQCYVGFGSLLENLHHKPKFK